MTGGAGIEMFPISFSKSDEEDPIEEFKELFRFWLDSFRLFELDD